MGFAGKSAKAIIPVDVAKAAAPRHNTVAKSFIMSTALGTETRNEICENYLDIIHFGKIVVINEIFYSHQILMGKLELDSV